jgi:hypothetical protein
MKRDMDLVRQILISLEEHTHGWAPQDLQIEGYSAEQIGYHVYLMDQAGLLVGTDVTASDSESPVWEPLYLAWAGHEFLDASRENGRWKQAKELVGKVGGASIAIWTVVLTDLVKQNLGLK